MGACGFKTNKGFLQLAIVAILVEVSTVEATHPVVLVPGSLHAGTTARFGVFTTEENVFLSLINSSTIFSGKSANVIASRSITAADEPQIVLMDLEEGISGSFVVSVTSESGSFHNETVVQINAASFFLAIELDKLVYKPGQTIRARVLGLSVNFKAIPNEAVVIDAEDPNGFIISRWEGLLDERGEMEIELLTSSEPVLGEWKLKVLVPYTLCFHPESWDYALMP
ncbi:hypothetical protein CYMTET_30217 [Cymbomonas tetramitiformis]|uniref:Macroglobulin domain-containing protein n=1 Tax=Cymbomonas tetramitiformis TaxID=36881 RepID=A0AAE0FJY5_9CHLO|nr:hypothetical protein CYMTET_30217 [Cymbomonas tetramitiformis]